MNAFGVFRIETARSLINNLLLLFTQIPQGKCLRVIARDRVRLLVVLLIDYRLGTVSLQEFYFAMLARTEVFEEGVTYRPCHGPLKDVRHSDFGTVVRVLLHLVILKVEVN